MFKILFNKPHNITIIHGYNCLDSIYCDCSKKCKHLDSFRFHNWSVRFHNYFKYHLRINLPRLLYICKKPSHLSGTTKCPFNKPRFYRCHHCKYDAGMDDDYNGICSNDSYINLNKEGRSIEHYVEGQIVCKFFDKNEWADRYDKNTGETIWDD